MVRRIVTPPPLPGIAFPRPSNGPKHIATQYPGPNILKRLKGEIVINASAPTTLTMHILEGLGLQEPRVQFETANSKRVIQILLWACSESIE
jgi:hypothetical protein